MGVGSVIVRILSELTMNVDSFVIADDHDTGSGALGNWNWGKDSSTNFYLTKTVGNYTNVIHGFVRFSTTTT